MVRTTEARIIVFHGTTTRTRRPRSRESISGVVTSARLRATRWQALGNTGSPAFRSTVSSTDRTAEMTSHFIAPDSRTAGDSPRTRRAAHPARDTHRDDKPKRAAASRARDDHSVTRCLIITGPAGVGKSSITEGASTLLISARIPHGAVDVDWLCAGYQQFGHSDMEMALMNLRAVWWNYRALGAGYLLIAGVVESDADVRRYADAATLDSVQVCRLRADETTIEARLRGRNTGDALEWHLARATELDRLLGERGIGDFVVDTEEKDHETVAREVLARAGWPVPP